MYLKLKHSVDDEWAFPEKYRKYISYTNKGYVEALVGVTANREFTTPYVFRAGKFIPASVIEEELGIEKYLKAKKPVYSRLSDGFVVSMRAYVNYAERAIDLSRSYFDVYMAQSSDINDDDTMTLVKVEDVPDEIVKFMSNLLLKLGKSFGDREAFLKERMKKDEL